MDPVDRILAQVAHAEQVNNAKLLLALVRLVLATIVGIPLWIYSFRWWSQTLLGP